MGDLIGTRLGDFEVARELGRGGMGVVFEAVQTSLGRRVALKVLRPGLSPHAVERFRREATAAARLHHTNIVPVYATGEADGFHYYAMELVDGPSLDRVLAGLRDRDAGAAADPGATVAHAAAPAAPPTPPVPAASGSRLSGSGAGYFDAVARMLADVADALHHAHQHGVIHRDIKPANLLLSPDGRLSVNDFGLARVVEEPGVTQAGDLLGTPAYMSPEQIAAGRVPVDRRTDVYSLGATLYELLTLHLPFVAAARDQLYAQILQKEPAAPRGVNPQVPRDLETVCLKCLEKDPDRRYATAKALADDLRRFVNRFAIAARRTGPLGKFRKWVKRNPAVAAAGLAVLLATAAAGYFAWQAGQTKTAAAKAERERREREQFEALDTAMVLALSGNRSEALRKVADAERLGADRDDVLCARGMIAVYDGNPAAAIGHLREAIGADPENDAARGLLSYAYGQLGDWEQAEAELAAARKLADRKGTAALSGRDLLFLGVAVGGYDPPAGIALMEQAGTRPDCPRIAPALRAEVRAQWAIDAGDDAQAEAALRDLAEAAGVLTNNPVVLAQRVYANLALATAHGTANRPDVRAAAVRAAGDANDALGRLPPSVTTATARWVYGSYADGLAGKLDMTAELRAVGEKTRSATVAFYEALNLFRLGRDEDALRVVRQFPADRYCQQLQLVICLTRPGDESRKEAVRAWKALTAPGASEERAGTALRYAWLLGDRALVREVTDYFDARTPSPTTTPAEKAAFLRFVDDGDEAALVRAMTRRPRLGNAYCMIGLRHLAPGRDRGKARAAFRDCHDLMLFNWTSWDLSTAFLVRMKEDRNWPSK